MKSGFLFPNGHFYEVNLDEIPYFCQAYCERRMKKSESIKKAYDIFSSKYHLFRADYDFIMHFFHPIHIGILGNKDSYGVVINHEIVIRTLPHHFHYQKEDYEKLLFNTDFITNSLIPYQDTSFQFEENIVPNEDGILFQNGAFYSLKRNECHPQIIGRFLLGAVATYDFVGKDIMEIDPINLYTYFLNRMGGVVLSLDEQIRYGLFLESLLSEKQKEIIDKLFLTDRIVKEYQDFNEPYISLENTKDYLNKLQLIYKK